MKCPCGHADYELCCGLRHSGAEPAPTAEALMRSRYSAFALGKSEYLAATQRATFEVGAGSWDPAAKWLGLTVHHARGTELDQSGEVEFTARYLVGDRLCTLHETSQFERIAGLWLYTTGTPRRAETRVERNAPCPCGSGRKFKSCCA